MLRHIVLITIALAVTATAGAAEPTARGLYAGGSIGTSIFDDDGSFFGLDFDDSGTAFQAHLGYKFLRFLAIEGRYSNYGTFAVESLEFDATAVSLHAVGIIPFGRSGWEMFGQLGLGSVKLEFDAVDEDQTTVAAGLGVRYHLTQFLSIGVQTDVHVWEDDFSVTPGVGATQLTVQFAF